MERLRPACLAKRPGGWAPHPSLPPYGLYQVGASSALHDLLRKGASWRVLNNARGWCRLRARLVPVAHVNGHPSRGLRAVCIFCGKPAPASFHHVLGECQYWEGPRRTVQRENRGGDAPTPMLHILLDILRPGERGREAAMAMEAAIDDGAHAFWKLRNH